MVLVIGVALILLPQNIEMNIAPEQVTIWEDTTITEENLGEYSFTLNTDSQEIAEGTSPYVEVWSDEDVTLNTSFAMLLGGSTSLNMNITDNPALFVIPEDNTVQILIKGTVVEGSMTEVNAGLYTLRPLPPEYITYYPYRFFGYGMAAIGAIASLVFYLRRGN